MHVMLYKNNINGALSVIPLPLSPKKTPRVMPSKKRLKRRKPQRSLLEHKRKPKPVPNNRQRDSP